MVVNDETGITSLTTGQLRGIYSGQFQNWQQVGGKDVPIRLVGRSAESGLRRQFESRLILGAESIVSSSNCIDRDRLFSAQIIRCERATEADQLEEVGRNAGAIGYAEAVLTPQFEHIHRVKLDGREPDISLAAQGRYPFWNVLYLYTHGVPPDGSLLHSFSVYLTGDAGQNVMFRSGYIPCGDSNRETIALCDS